MRRILLGLMCLVLLGACTTVEANRPAATPAASPAAPQADPALDLLKQYRWTPQGTPTEGKLTVEPDGGPPPFPLYHEASRTINLDFTALAWQELIFQKYYLGADVKAGHAVHAYVLLKEGRPVGAWVGVEQEYPGIYPLNTDQVKLKQ